MTRDARTLSFLTLDTAIVSLGVFHGVDTDGLAERVDARIAERARPYPQLPDVTVLIYSPAGLARSGMKPEEVAELEAGGVLIRDAFHHDRGGVGTVLIILERDDY